jgi:hypothetical protein
MTGHDVSKEQATKYRDSLKKVVIGIKEDKARVAVRTGHTRQRSKLNTLKQ